jgi:tight adherence protein C
MNVNIIIWIILGVVVIGGAIALIVAGSRVPKDDEDPLASRLAEFSERGDLVSLEEIELSQPLMERVVYPALRKMGEFSARFTPQSQLHDISIKLEMAGNPMRMDAGTFFALRLATTLGLPAFLGLVFMFAPSRPGTMQIAMIVGGAVLAGYFLPTLFVKSRIDRRQKEIRNAMPDALDLLTICVEAGLGFDAAMTKVSEKWENELSMAFARTIREIQLGKTRREALKDMADRIGLAELTSFVAAVIQSEQLGVSMAKVLRIQSEQMRMKRRQRAEEEAHKAPIKMILPMGLLIFPSILIILLTPAGLIFRKLFADFM